jgi:hypothetical protein
VSGTIGSGPVAFYTTLPSGYAAAAGTGTTTAAASATTDIVDIRVPLPAGTFTTRAGDSLSVRELFGSPEADLMRVALRGGGGGGGGGGKLLLRGTDVTSQTDFYPMDFNELQFVAGADGSAQEIVAVARKGTKDAGGTWTKIADSEPVQITALVTGTRSIEAAGALRTASAAGDANAAFISLARDAAVFAGSTSRPAPALSTAGNVTLKAGDAVALHDLFSVAGKTGAALYRVALRQDEDSPGGALVLNGTDVTDRTDFTPEEFNNLQFIAGPAGSAQDLLVVARAGTKGEDGTWRNIVDSPATEITASVTGTRSANAASALRTAVDPADGDANFLRVAQEATIFAPLGSRTAPTVSGAGEITVKAGDSLSLHDLFPTSGKTEAALYRVALRDDPDGPSGGRLMLNGEDVTARTDFSPVEFLGLQYVAGPEGGAQDLMVVARAGTPDGKGGLTGIADSPPALLRAAVTGTRSLNTAEALRTPVDPAASDADFMKVASEAALYAPLGSQVAPGLVTAGNFTAAAGDGYALRDLFASPDSTKVSVSGYRVALRDADAASGAKLMLDGEDVTHRIDFTATEFNSLKFVAGSAGSAPDLLVAARSTDSKGMPVDSRAVQVTARITGERSINALPALRNASPDDAFARIAQDAATYAPLGSQTAPALSAVGDFSAAAGDLFSMNTLFGGKGSVYDAGMSFRVALRDDAGMAGGGRLLLNGDDVTGRTEFSGTEFAGLIFRAGPAGSAQDLMVVARRTGSSGLITDSPAQEITARTTGTRSINAMAALRTDDAADTGYDRIVRDAAVYGTSTAPKLSSTLQPAIPLLAAGALASAIGAYRATGSATAALDLSALYGGMVGASQAAGAVPARMQQLSDLVTLLGGGTVGGVRTTGADIGKLAALALNARA